MLSVFSQYPLGSLYYFPTLWLLVWFPTSEQHLGLSGGLTLVGRILFFWGRKKPGNLYSSMHKFLTVANGFRSINFSNLIHNSLYRVVLDIAPFFVSLCHLTKTFTQIFVLGFVSEEHKFRHNPITHLKTGNFLS